MKLTLPLTDEQRSKLQPFFDASRGGTHLLVASLHPGSSRTERDAMVDGSPLEFGWRLTVSALPAERRDSIRAACAGELKLKIARKKKSAEC